MFLHLDCRHYLGDRPCKFHRLCEGCPHYEPMGPRVLIIKLGALGDVVRTGCLLSGLAAASEAPYVTWLTAPEAVPLVRRMPGVHRVLPFDAVSLARLDVETFDVVYSLDKEAAPCAVAMRVKTDARLGIGLSRYGTVHPLNEECEYYFSLGLDDEEKFRRNEKTYAALIYEALGLPYAGQRHRLETTEEDRAAADALLRGAGVEGSGPLIGINPGAGRVFANKAWRPEGYVELMGEVGGRVADARFLLLGGADEAGLIGRLRAAGGARALSVGTHHPLGVFAALIERCGVVVSGDTLAMHLAVGVGRRSVAIFGPTCPQEIDLFGLGEKIVTPIGCSPCYLHACDKSPTCQDMIPTRTVVEAVLRQIGTLAQEAPRVG